MPLVESLLSLPSDSQMTPAPASFDGAACPSPAALEALRPILRRSAAAILRRGEDIDDAVQDALLKLIQHSRHIDSQTRSLEGLASVTVRRVALDMLARKNPLVLQEDMAQVVAPGGEPALDAAHVRGRLSAAVDELPDPQRVVFLLVHQEGLKPTQAARELGLTHQCVRARLYRARLQLRAALRDLRP
jgi:RNA polymerase sigma-70 factor, ECF subfamily